MKTISFKSSGVSLFVIFFLLGAAESMAGEYKAMQGVKSTDTVFDFRISDPAAALGHLTLIHTMMDDPNMIIKGSRPGIVLVFIGPSVKLVSTDPSRADPRKSETQKKIADKIAAMKKDGFRFEICMAAVHAHGVSPETILPGVEKVENGWISVVGYQKKGYSMVADF